MSQSAQPTSFARIIITPIIVIAAGYLIFGLPGAAVGAIIGIVYILWASRRGRGATPAKAPSSGTNTAAMQDLADMRSRGLITEQEYETKKAELLRRV